MAVGGVALKKIGDVKHVFDDGDHPGFFPAAIIALGALVFVIAFFGCCGAIRESRELHFILIIAPNVISCTISTDRMPLESLLAVPARRRRSSSSSRHLRARLQPRHSDSCLQGLGSLVERTSSF